MKGANMKDSTMKAIIFEKFGSAEVLKEAELPTPEMQRGEVLIHIQHTSVNPVDWKIREGFLQEMLPHQFPIIPGWDLAGEVLMVGESVSRFKVGDRVFAYGRLPTVQNGTYAEMISLPESYLALIPSALNSAQAAAVPLAGLTAYQSLFEIAKVKEGDRVLILGGAGGVGSFAIQFANLAGAEVTATSGTSNLNYIKNLGARNAVNYTEGDLVKKLKEAAPNGYDVVFDAIGGETLRRVQELTHQNSRIVSIVETPVRGSFHFVYPNGNHLQQIGDLFMNGKLKIPEIKIKNIREASRAQEENAQGHVRGKLVLEVDFNKLLVH
jgi:NADPH2:quinone reductase